MTELGDYKRLVEKPMLAAATVREAKLRAENEQLRAAIQPFADAAKDADDWPDSTTLSHTDRPCEKITYGHLRQARDALGGNEQMAPEWSMERCRAVDRSNIPATCDWPRCCGEQITTEEKAAVVATAQTSTATAYGHISAKRHR